MMKNKKYKGFSVFFVALLLCSLFMFRQGRDRYSVQFNQNEFKQKYIENYSDDNTSMLWYVPESESSITLLTKGPLSLEPGEYTVELQYAANDETSVFKIFAPDYVSEDNSGGKIFINEKINNNDSQIITKFSLDQKIDSLYITVETKDDNFRIGRVNLNNENITFNDSYFLCFVTIISAIIIFILYNKEQFKILPISLNGENISSRRTVALFAFISVCSIFIASLPVLKEGLIVGHDLPFHMARIEGISRALQSGQFPVRVHAGTLNDYGYGNSLFYPELLMYIPAFLRTVGISTLLCYKIYIIFINVLTLLVGYIAFKKFTNNRCIALTISILYLLSPYRLICAYFRAAIGEFTAMTFLPLVLYGLYAILIGKKNDWLYLTVGATGILQSHILSTELTSAFSVIIVLIFIKNLFTKEKRILPLIYAAISTILINIWFIGPMLIMMAQLGLSVFSRKQNPFLYAKYDINNLFTSFTLFDVGPHTVGWVGLFTVVFYILYRISHEKDVKYNTFYKFSDTIAVLSIIFTIGTTAYFPWDIISKIPVIGGIFDIIQFPYRLLILVQACIVLLLSITIMLWIKNKNITRIVCAVVVCISVFLTSLMYEVNFVRGNPENIENKNYYTNYMDISLSVGQAEYLVEGSNLNDIVANPPVLESDNETLIVNSLYRYGTKTSFKYNMELSDSKENVIVLPIMYIPNYKILVNGQIVNQIKYDGGRVAFIAPAESGSVTINYVEPMTFRVFEIISLISIISLIFYKKRYNKK